MDQVINTCVYPQAVQRAIAMCRGMRRLAAGHSLASNQASDSSYNDPWQEWYNIQLGDLSQKAAAVIEPHEPTAGA